ncbi:MAG: hypothetical protein H7X77_02630, partial [Anaerolineae bacterium]|nr:hypothetical protein [Anaerolineae bacterium]
MRKIIPVAMLLVVMFLFTSVFAQSTSTSVGVPSAGQHAFELVGRIDQQLFNTTAFGYVTYINGVPAEDLFGENAPAMMRGEADARITFFGTGISTSRSIYENIFQAVLPVELTFYYSETPAGASFDNPDLFKSGTPIATFNLRMQTILNVQEPNVGVLMGSGESTQNLAEAFTL